MLASQVNLDYRLAEFRQIGNELRDAQAARGTGPATRSLAAVIRSLLGRALATRPIRISAH